MIHMIYMICIYTHIYICSYICSYACLYHCCLASIRINKTVFSSFLKLASELLLERSSTGKLFQEQGPDTANALGPIVFVLHAGTTNIPDAAERGVPDQQRMTPECNVWQDILYIL